MSKEKESVAPPGIWRRIARALFDGGVADAIFAHLRNLVMATLVLAAGIHVAHGGATIAGDVGFAGVAVATLGAVLIALNFLDGLYKLSAAPRPRLLQLLAVAAYLLLFIHLVQLLVAFRGPA